MIANGGYVSMPFLKKIIGIDNISEKEITISTWSW